MRRTALSQNAVPSGLPALNRSWPFAGGGIRDIGMDGRYVDEPQAPAGPDEVIARIDAVCICSSDIKIIRMGKAHPLFADRDLADSPAVLGHEMALTIVDAGANWRDRFRPGDRLGLQPAIMVEGRRRTVGMDLPGAFAEYIRLDARVLAGEGPYVFPVPADVSAATIAMLEPYACVEAAYRPNCRTSLKSGGRLLVVEAVPGTRFDRPAPDGEVVLVGAGEAARAWAGGAASVAWHESLDAFAASEAGQASYDDIILAGRLDAEATARLANCLAKGGLMVLVGSELGHESVILDAARIHYHELSFLGSPGPSLSEAFLPARTRFELRAGGIALVLGAGGAMGRIHTHRALELKDGPATVIATSRKGARLKALEDDFAPLARQHGKTLVVIEDGEVEACVARLAPEGCDDVVVVAPEVAVIERGARLMRADGMLVLFAGMPFGQPCALPLGLVSSANARITGSTGCTVADQLAVLDRVVEGSLELSGNLEAVAGLGALPDALEAVNAGKVSGKIAIYPALLDLPVTPVRDLRQDDQPVRWSLEDEKRLFDGGISSASQG
ncbi:alcohol dehydrogenase catalytic domain-containing protein [Labrys sp. (in: a-proteobacteria)]|uniref:alcohol dehydrogenase catalytic domain-containing protein n=1 Tax=Labrys sp. (in: a-proteobacteria) TaxID=1917972 RepID=UPI0039E40B3D